MFAINSNKQVQAHLDQKKMGVAVELGMKKNLHVKHQWKNKIMTSSGNGGPFLNYWLWQCFRMMLYSTSKNKLYICRHVNKINFSWWSTYCWSPCPCGVRVFIWDCDIYIYNKITWIRACWSKSWHCCWQRIPCAWVKKSAYRMTGVYLFISNKQFLL